MQINVQNLLENMEKLSPELQEILLRRLTQGKQE
jgi:hypothetical protein